MVDGEMGCEESCHKISATQHHLHIYEVKTTVTTQQRDRRKQISSTNLLSISLTWKEANTFVMVFVVSGPSDEGRRGPARRQEPLLARLSRGTHRANASRIEILHKKKLQETHNETSCQQPSGLTVMHNLTITTTHFSKNKMRKKDAKVHAKHVRPIGWRVCKSPTASLSLLLQSILDGRQRNAATATRNSVTLKKHPNVRISGEQKAPLVFLHRPKNSTMSARLLDKRRR